MTTPATQRRRADADATPSVSSRPIPVQTTFRHMETSAAVAGQIDQEAQKLRRYFDRIAHCHVVVSAPHKHHRHGRHYSIHVELGVPRGPLVVSHDPDSRPDPAASPRAQKQAAPNATHEDIYVALRDTFDVVRRRLEDYARKLRGDTGRRAPPSAEESD